MIGPAPGGAPLKTRIMLAWKLIRNHPVMYRMSITDQQVDRGPKESFVFYNTFHGGKAYTLRYPAND